MRIKPREFCVVEDVVKKVPRVYLFVRAAAAAARCSIFSRFLQEKHPMHTHVLP